MIERYIPIDKVAPWLVSGASSLYVVVRARRLSLAKPSRASLPNFLRDQSDMILMLLGGPMVWHFSRQLVRRDGRGNGRSVGGLPKPGPLHQMRQVFTALLIGTGLLMRKASEGKTTETIALAARLHRIVRDGVNILASFDELRLVELIDPMGDIYTASAGGNGWKS